MSFLKMQKTGKSDKGLPFLPSKIILLGQLDLAKTNSRHKQLQKPYSEVGKLKFNSRSTKLHYNRHYTIFSVITFASQR